MPLRPFTAKDFVFTNEDIQRVMQEMETLVSGPRPFNTFNPIVLLCAICQQEMTTGEHRCPTMIACVRCGDTHLMQSKECW